MSAEAVSAQHQIPKIRFGPKEALGFVNGTVSSAKVWLLLLLEAMLGHSESFHPFISEIRPHPGQNEVNCNVLSILQGSHLANGIRNGKDHASEGIFQDQYAPRRKHQWIGTRLEDLLAANKQIAVELNPWADNLIVDFETQDVYSDANF